MTYVCVCLLDIRMCVFALCVCLLYVCVCSHGIMLATNVGSRKKMIMLSHHGTQDSVVIFGSRCWSNLCACVCALKNLLSSASFEGLETDIEKM